MTTPPTPPAVGEVPTVEFFDPTGVTSLGVPAQVEGLQWVDAINEYGTGSVHIPLEDAVVASLTERCIAKFTLRGRTFGVRLTSEVCQLATEPVGTSPIKHWLRFDNALGLLSMLNDDVVQPEYGLRRQSGQDRHFGYMSADAGGWRVTANWHAPIAVPWADPGGRHFALPLGFTTADKWIARTSPNTGVSSSTQNWFICDFTMADERDVKILAAGDNFLEMYMDGEPILSVDYGNYFGWRKASEIPLRLKGGAHRWAVRIQNAVPVAAYAGTPNPVGFIANMFAVDGDGAATGSAIVRTNTTDWIVTDINPAWHRGQILKKLIDEAKALSVAAGGPPNGIDSLTLGFTATTDSNGVAWSDTPVEFAFSIGNVGLGDVAIQLAQSGGFDVDVDAATMTLHAYNRKGADLSATVELKLGPAGGSLKSYETTRTATRFTVALTQLLDGTWLQTTDAAGLAAAGRLVAGVSLGSTGSNDTAGALARAFLNESAQPLVSVTAEASSLTGAQAYVHYTTGDTAKAPAHRNAGTMKARALSISVDSTAVPLRAWPQIVEDRSV